jgi:hypothetical protein
VHRIWGRAADIILVRLGRREVGDERRHPACWVRRDGLSRGRRREGVGMESDALRSVRRSPFSRGGAFAARDVRALVALGQGTRVWGDNDRVAVVDGRRMGEVGLAEAWGGREVHARAEGRGTKGERQRAVCGRRWVKV